MSGWLMRIRAFNLNESARWDEFISGTAQGVFLHTRRFLSYHQGRFSDHSLLIENSKGRLRAVLPAAKSLQDSSVVVSHPGLTFGGLLHDPACQPDEIDKIFACVFETYKAAGFKKFIYRSVPTHVHRVPVAIDQHALWRAGGKLFRRDLWNVLDLRSGFRPSERHRRNVKKSSAAGVKIAEAVLGDFQAFYDNLRENLKKRYRVAPTHSLSELLKLQALFEDQISLWIARGPDASLIAGIMVFKYQRSCWHTQYITSCETGRRLFALNLVMDYVIRVALDSDVKVISFGSSAENNGISVNLGLFEFKSGFGHGSAVHDFIEIEL